MQKFRYQHRVTYAESTVGDHVYHSRYLDILEAARGEFCRALGMPVITLQQNNTIFPVVECRLRYKSPARYDDVLTVELWISRLERVQVEFSYRVFKAEDVDVLVGTTLHACTTDEKIQRIPEALRKALGPFLAA